MNQTYVHQLFNYCRLQSTFSIELYENIIMFGESEMERMRVVTVAYFKVKSMSCYGICHKPFKPKSSHIAVIF
jgi:hypothetical protein